MSSATISLSVGNSEIIKLTFLLDHPAEKVELMILHTTN